MKTIQVLFVGIMIVFGLGQTSCSSPNAVSKKEQAQLIKQRIENRNYTIAVSRMLPMNGRSRTLTSNYSLEIKGDTVVSYLPYFGQAYSVPYGGGEGLSFEAPITVYSVSFDQKGTAIITLQTRSKDDRYLYRIQVYNNGSSTIHVTSNNRQAISYYGDVELK